MAWRFTSHAQLVQAGYRYLTEVPCQHCTANVLIYQAPEGWRIALERGTFAQHRLRCAGGQVLTRQKALFEANG